MSARRRVLVLFAHPALEKSRVHRRLIEAARGVEGVVVNDLYEAYPDLDIDVEREQRMLEAADAVVFQHPFYWYSTPAILKQWQDLVLQHGWAFGSGGTALRGKLIMAALSAGGRRESYAHGGHNRFAIADFLRPLEQTGHLCGMRWLPPFTVYGTHSMDERDCEGAARDYAVVLSALRDGLVDPDALSGLDELSAASVRRTGGADPDGGRGGPAADGTG